MGWKSTVTISRKEAIDLITDRLNEATNDEISDALEGIGFGDNIDLKYFGNNFTIVDNVDEDN